jgi:hypothetical protein
MCEAIESPTDVSSSSCTYGFPLLVSYKLLGFASYLMFRLPAPVVTLRKTSRVAAALQNVVRRMPAGSAPFKL